MRRRVDGHVIQQMKEEDAEEREGKRQRIEFGAVETLLATLGNAGIDSHTSTRPIYPDSHPWILADKYQQNHRVGHSVRHNRYRHLPVNIAGTPVPTVHRRLCFR